MTGSPVNATSARSTAFNTLIGNLEAPSFCSEGILCWQDFVRDSCISKDGWVSAKCSYSVQSCSFDISEKCVLRCTTKASIWSCHTCCAFTYSRSFGWGARNFRTNREVVLACSIEPYALENGKWLEPHQAPQCVPCHSSLT